MRLFFMGMLVAFAGLQAIDDPRFDQAHEAYFDRDFDKAIALYEGLLSDADSADRGRFMVKLALCHYRNQDDVKAFGTYLQALDAAPFEEPERDGEEDNLCEEALALYLDPDRSNAREVAAELRHKYAHTCDIHPEYRYLSFFLAAAYANLGMFDEFFERFYPSYCSYADSYMGQKTRGLLHVKLMERLPDAVSREEERKKAVACFRRALAHYAQDVGLHKMTAMFSTAEERGAVVKASLQTILDHHIVVPRLDVFYFVNEALNAEAVDQARTLVDRSREWYSYSRAVKAAEDLLTQHKKGE